MARSISNEKKINVIVLLKIVYDDNVAKAAREMRYSPSDLKKWRDEFEPDVINLLRNRVEQMFGLKDDSVDAFKMKIPTLEEIEDEAMLMLGELIKKPMSADKLAQTIETIYKIRERAKKVDVKSDKESSSMTLKEIMDVIEKE